MRDDSPLAVLSNLPAPLTTVLLLLLFAVLVAGLSAFLWRRELGRVRSRMATLEAEAAATADTLKDAEIAAMGLKTRLDEKSQVADALLASEREARAAWQNAETRLAAREASAATERRSFEAEIARINSLQAELKKDFEALATQAIKTNQESFLENAKAIFEQQRENVSKAGAEHQDKLKLLIDPMAEQMKRYEEGLKAFDAERQKTHTELKAELGTLAKGQEQVSQEARRLAMALKAKPTVRGRWGEEALRNILDLAGMSPFADYSLQETFKGGEARLRPDAVINLPGGRKLIIDAKTALDAYIDAVNSADDDQRAEHLVRHARHIRTHMEGLAAKAYWEALRRELGATPDFVVMFVPGENFLAAAAEHDPAIFQDSFKRNVILTTPATLLALAKAIAFGWQQEKVSENAKKVAEAGRELYARLRTLGEHLTKLGGAIKNSAAHYNAFVGSLESQVLPQAKRFEELEVVSVKPGEEIAAPPRVESEIREPRRDKFQIEIPNQNEQLALPGPLPATPGPHWSRA